MSEDTSTANRAMAYLSEFLDDAGGKWCLFGCVLVLSVMVSSILTSIDDAAVAREQKSVHVAAEEQATIRNQQTLDKLEVLVKEHNYGPVAARCAVIGWGIDKKDRNLCAEAMRLHHAN